ncbi:MAG: band-7 C-terminal domain-containing protein, partial [Hyphomonadaceae bacterium]
MVSDAISSGDVNALNYFLGQSYVEAFGKLASSPQQRTVIVPTELSAIASAIEGVRQLTMSGTATQNQGQAKAPSRTAVPTTKD